MLKILIADDETISRISIKDVIQEYFDGQVQVFEAWNGKQAVEETRHIRFDIVLMDIEMPVMDGIKASYKLKECCPECIIIFLTAYAEFDYARHAISLGVMEYLVKPVEAEELVQVMCKAMKKKGIEGVGREEREQEIEEEIREAYLKDNGAAAGVRAARISADEKKYIELHYMEEMTNERIAGYFNLSVNYFNKIFKTYCQSSCKEYIIHIRVEKAKEFLKLPVYTIKEVGIMVGYGDSNYFTRIFKKKTGMTPIEYRNQVFFQPET